MVKKSKNKNIKVDNSMDYITFCIHTAKYKTLPTKKYLNRKSWVKVDPNNIISDIPGGIRKIYVVEGEKLSKGSVIIELDAMKMYNRILAPFDCIVKKIYVEENQKVSKNFLLVELSEISE
jgi:biotin carboxyl carrier protein